MIGSGNIFIICTLYMTGLMHSLSFSLFFFSHQVLSYIAKGSFGPILKVKDKAKQRTYAVKVSLLPGSHLLNAFI